MMPTPATDSRSALQRLKVEILGGCFRTAGTIWDRWCAGEPIASLSADYNYPEREIRLVLAAYAEGHEEKESVVERWRKRFVNMRAQYRRSNRDHQLQSASWAQQRELAQQAIRLAPRAYPKGQLPISAIIRLWDRHSHTLVWRLVGSLDKASIADVVRAAFEAARRSRDHEILALESQASPPGPCKR